MKNRSFIVLLTDFGIEDPYVGIMKGIILNIAPSCHLIDLTHQIQPQNILQASCLLSFSYQQFPKNTVFVCVVDPGVGTLRKCVLVRAYGYYFIGPDNGLFGFLNSDTHKTIIHLQNEKFFRTPVSKTFHGRDIFAPVAAHLVTQGEGILHELGPEQQRLSEFEGFAPLIKPGYIEGTIVHIDRFGNLISNIHSSHIELFAPTGSNAVIRFKGETLPLVSTFAEAPDGKPCALIGSSSHLELFVKNQNAQEALEATLGEKIYVIKHHG